MISSLQSRTLPFFLLALCLLQGRALAQEEAPLPELPESFAFKAPGQWGVLPGHSDKIAGTVEQAAYFGDEETEHGARVYGRADRGALYLSWVRTTKATTQAEELVRHAFDELHEAPYLASPVAGSTQEVSYRESNKDGVLHMDFEWAHLSNETVNMIRAIAWKDAEQRLHLYTGECVYHTEGSNESRPLCEESLAALHLKEPAAPTPIGQLAEPRQVNRPAAMEVPELETNDLQMDKMPAPEAPAMGLPPKGAPGEILYDGRRSAEEDKIKNRYIIGIGVILLAVAVWLTTRKGPEAEVDDEDEASDESKDEDEESKA